MHPVARRHSTVLIASRIASDATVQTFAFGAAVAFVITALIICAVLFRLPNFLAWMMFPLLWFGMAVRLRSRALARSLIAKLTAPCVIYAGFALTVSILMMLTDMVFEQHTVRIAVRQLLDSITVLFGIKPYFLAPVECNVPFPACTLIPTYAALAVAIYRDRRKGVTKVLGCGMHVRQLTNSGSTAEETVEAKMP